MLTPRYQRLESQIREAIAHPEKRQALYRAMKRGRDSRALALHARADGDAFRDEVKERKGYCVEHLDELLERFVAKAEQRGARVFLANNGEEAIAYILQLAAAKGASSVAKSKSLTSEEILVNEPMERAGLQVIETDLGELIIQLVHEKPYHLVFPAVHKTVAEVAKIFHDTTGATIGSDIPSIMEVVRKYLRPIFLNADIGMTGANFAIAENGAIGIETNEGNARLVSSIPDIHICIMGREKIVESIEDALLMMLAHPLSAVGQLTTTYVTFMAGRCPMGVPPAQAHEHGGAGVPPARERERTREQDVMDDRNRESTVPRESHIIILDNGRTQMRDDKALREALHCIRCGACMNICPTYGVVGGHTFGYIYPGPIGIPWTAAAHGLENAADFAPLCISCGLCKEICPADIDIPMMIAEVKHRDAKTHGHPTADRAMMAAERSARLGSRFAPLTNRLLRSRTFRRILEHRRGIDARRILPRFTHRPFLKLYKPTHGNDNRHNAAYFVDLFANFYAPHIAAAAVALLNGLGYNVLTPPQRGSGYPYIGYGDLDRARGVADFHVRQFAPLAEQGCPIIATEPTAAYCLQRAYPKLLDYREDAQQVARNSFELFEFLVNRDPSPEYPRLDGRRFGLHLSCHQRPLGAGQALVRYLESLGAQVQVIETGTCCGMGGTFGIKAGPLGFDLANTVGEPLFALFREAAIDGIVTESSVCRIHLAQGTGLPVYHPLELLRPLARPEP
jgi:L-lactate dehydrogenase complex protein LldF